MSKKKMSRTDHDIVVDNSKLKSCFSFDNDLKVGEIGEKYVQSIFGDANVTIEVKKDDWTIKSGNIAIEFESRGKPSGIQVTKADYWAHVVGHYFVLVFPVDFLRQVYQQLSTQSKYVKRMGDRDGRGVPLSRAILIPWVELLQMFSTYQPCTKSS